MSTRFPTKDFEHVMQQHLHMRSDAEIAARVLPLIDLTSLNDDDNDAKITKLCEQATTKHGNVAAICVYAPFVKVAKKILAGKNIGIATVVNFPNGNSPLSAVLTETHSAIAAGANEIDVVFPYQSYLADGAGKKNAAEMIRQCREACGKKALLKVILEVGAPFWCNETLYAASHMVIDCGADFLKTSTGKIPIGATFETAAVMLLAIANSGKKVGFKASGGVRDLQQANGYLNLGDIIMGKDWITPHTFRFGASALLKAVVEALG